MGLSEAEYGTTDITEEKAEQKDKQSSTKHYIENQIKVCNNVSLLYSSSVSIAVSWYLIHLER